MYKDLLMDFIIFFMKQSIEIEKIKNKIITSGWSRWIKNIEIKGLHALNNLVEFKFPIVQLLEKMELEKAQFKISCLCI